MLGKYANKKEHGFHSCSVPSEWFKPTVRVIVDAEIDNAGYPIRQDKVEQRKVMLCEKGALISFASHAKQAAQARAIAVIVVADTTDQSQSSPNEESAKHLEVDVLVVVVKGANWDRCVKPGEIGRVTMRWRNQHGDVQFGLSPLFQHPSDKPGIHLKALEKGTKKYDDYETDVFNASEVRKATDEEVAEQIPCLIINSSDAKRLRQRGSALICLPKEFCVDPLDRFGCIPERWIARSHSEKVHKSIRQLDKKYQGYINAKRALKEMEEELAVNKITRDKDVKIMYKSTRTDADDENRDILGCGGPPTILFQRATFSPAVPPEWGTLDIHDHASSANDNEEHSFADDDSTPVCSTNSA